MVNKVTLIGNLGSDPEVRHLENGASVAQFSVATTENYKDNMGNWQNKTEWHRVVAWRGLAERAQTSLKKGTLVYVEGKISTRKWQDQNGNDRYSTEVVANYFRVVNSRDGSSGGGGSNNFPTAQDEPATFATSSDNTPATANESQVAESMDDDLPF